LPVSVSIFTNPQQINDTTWKSAMPVTVPIFTNPQQINDITWKSAMPVNVPIFTKLAKNPRKNMEICYACHCIDFH